MLHDFGLLALLGSGFQVFVVIIRMKAGVRVGQTLGGMGSLYIMGKGSAKIGF